MTLVLALVLVAASGFVSLSYEILWFRVFSFLWGGAPAVFGLLLGAFLVGLAAGAFGGGIYCRSRMASGNPKQLRALAGFTLVANLAALLVIPALAWLAARGHWHWAFALVSVPSALFGATLPLTSQFGIAPNRLAGAHMSYLYLANILGSAGGSLLTGFVLLDVWPLRTIALALALLGVAIATGTLLAARPRPVTIICALATMIGIAALLIGWHRDVYAYLYEKLLYKERFTTALRFRHVVETRSGVVTVAQGGEVFGSGAYDGMVSTDLRLDPSGIVRAYAIAAIHPRPRHVLMIGLATGAWAQVVANLAGVERLTVIEINPGYLRIIPSFAETASLLNNPRVEIIIDDGRRWLARHPDRMFDVIVANTTWNWRAFATNLLSREYLSLVRRHLQTGGLYYFNTTESPEAMRTAFSLFPHGLRLMNFAAVSDAPIVVDTVRWRFALTKPRSDGVSVLDPSLGADRDRLQEVLALVTTLGQPNQEFNAMEWREHVLARLGSGLMITDDNMISEWRQLVPYIWVPPLDQ